MACLRSNSAIPDESIILEECEAMHPTSNTARQLAVCFVLITEQKLAIETCESVAILANELALKGLFGPQ